MTPQARDPLAANAVTCSPSRAPRIKRALAKTAAGLAVATLVVGALHMPFARHLLARVGGCPMMGKMTVAAMENARHISAASSRTGDSAPARPALGFALDSTTLAEVHAWARRTHADCDDVRAGFVKCADVPASAVGAAAGEGKIDELAFGFDAKDRLVNLTTLRTGLRADDAARTAQGIAASLYANLGVATKSGGDFAPQHLAQAGTASLATRSYRYRDYVADLTALNLPASGLALREHYMSARD